MIVFDASTLILLAKVELLGKFLDSSREKIVISQEVERECCRLEQSLDALLIRRAIRERLITVKSLKDKRLLGKISADFNLGKGEVETIALGLSGKAQLVAIDDKQGINACKLLRLPFTTAIAILIRMHEKGLIETQAALLKLEGLQHYGRYKNSIISDARLQLEGSK